MRIHRGVSGLCLLLCVIIGGCSFAQHNEGSMSKYAFSVEEADWIMEGEPIEFQGQWWYPQDDVDILLDTEVVLRGEYKGVQFFTTRTDVKPFHKIYTKFGRNKFRIFKIHHDPS